MSTEVKIDKQTAKFIARIAENLPDMGGDMMQEWIDNPIDLRNYLKGLGAPHDTIIRIDRSVRPAYVVDGADIETLHPELESTGPSEYDLAKILRHVDPRQKSENGLRGYDLYESLKAQQCLQFCLGLQDALEIRKKGLRIFRKLFGRSMVHCWKSICKSRNGYLVAPCVHEIDGGRNGDDRLVMDWGRVSNPVSEMHFAALFPK